MSVKIGDTVKVTKKTMYQGKRKELIPIGTICRVVDVDFDTKDGNVVGIVPLDNPNNYGEYYYLENEVEKGHMEWVKDS